MLPVPCAGRAWLCRLGGRERVSVRKGAKRGGFRSVVSTAWAFRNSLQVEPGEGTWYNGETNTPR
jgi:hypothetical protein